MINLKALKKCEKKYKKIPKKIRLYFVDSNILEESKLSISTNL